MLALTAAGLLALAQSASAAVPFKDMGAPTGPLNHVQVGNELGCQAQHTGDTALEMYPSDVSPGDCGAMLATGGTLFTPDFSNHGNTFTGSLGPRTPYTPVSQTAVTGSGSAADPFKVVTIVDAGATGLRITETDTYVAGQESYRTDVAVANGGGTGRDVVLYRAADCFLQDSDLGFGFTESNGGVGCAAVANNNPPGRIIEWVPITGGSNFSEDGFSNDWSQIRTQGPFPNTCAQCNNRVDNGAGLSWSFNVPAGGSQTRSHFTTFSPTGTTIAGGGAGSGSSPSPTPSSTSTPTPTPTPPALPATPPATGPPAGPTVGPRGNPLGLPSNRQCIDKRKFSFRLRRPAGRVVEAKVFINKVPTQTKRAFTIRRLTIAKLPNSGKFVVRIEALSANGTRLISQRTYTRCKKSKVKGKKVKPRR